MGGYRVKKPYPYVHEIRDRHGHLRAYLRKPGCPSVTLPLQIGSRAFVEAYQAALEVAPKIIGRTEFRCAQGCHTDCSVLMRLAILEGWRNDNPVSAVERIKIKSDGHRTWTDEEIAAFEAFYPIGTEARLAFALLLYTGQRRSDVVRMGRQHIKNGFITIVQAKTKVEVSIPILPQLQAVLDKVQSKRIAPAFIVTAYGKTRTNAGFTNWFRDLRIKAGLPEGLSPHGLRKAFCRIAAEGGLSPHHITAISGHKTLTEVTRYTRAADRKRLAIEGMRMIEKRTGCGNPPDKVSNRNS